MEKRDIKGINTVDVEGLEDLKPGTGVDVGNDTKYEYASELKFDGVPVVDSGLGKTVSLRTFTFKIDPSKVKMVPSDKQRIFNDHAGFIKRTLWGDGLIPLEGISPRVIMNKRKYTYQIIVPCEARLNTMWLEKPENLSVLLAKEAKNGKLDPKKN